VHVPKSIDQNWGYKSEELSTLYEKAKDYQAGQPKQAAKT
jgi:hypothetical protein